MSRQLFLTSYPDKLEHVLPLRAFLSQKLTARYSPFQPLPPYVQPLLWIILELVSLIEWIAGTEIFVTNELRDFASIDSRSRRLLTKLLKREIIVSWRQASIQSDLPTLVIFLLTFADQKTPLGKTFRIQGNLGQGHGRTVAESILPALAETLERHSLCTWDPRRFIYASYKELKAAGAVDPQTFVVYSGSQLKEKTFNQSICDENTKLHWINADSVTDQRTCYIPAQTVFLNFEGEYSDEVVFGPSTTNGAAAAATREEAVYKGLCENIERDGFLIYWLNTRAPQVVDIADHPILGPILNQIKRYGIDIYILDTRTELQIPSFCAVVIDRLGSKSVSVSAGAGLEVERVLEKLLWDSISHLHFETQEHLKEKEIQTEKKHPQTFEDRKILWSSQDMVKAIDFFVAGKHIPLETIVNTIDKSIVTSAHRKLKYVVDALKAQHMEAFIVDVSSPEARSERLSVVQTVVPALIPMYFNEDKKPLGVKRLFTVSEFNAGTEKKLEVDLNSTPHPFI